MCNELRISDIQLRNFVQTFLKMPLLRCTGSFIFPSDFGMSRVARFFLVQTYQIGKNIPNDRKLNQSSVNYTK
jgi:hypothetical protein